MKERSTRAFYIDFKFVRRSLMQYSKRIFVKSSLLLALVTISRETVTSNGRLIHLAGECDTDKPSMRRAKIYIGLIMLFTGALDVDSYFKLKWK
jgi:hypothetical protein